MKLSILIPSIESRKVLLSELVCDLITQCGIIKSISSFIQEGCSIVILVFEKVEIIIAIDDRKITTGDKRNLLLNLSKNDYVTMIDDDDYVYPYFIEEIMNAIKSGVDCIGTRGIITTDGQDEIEWRLSKDYRNETIRDDGRMVYLRTTNHISIVRRNLAMMAMFPSKSNAEDKEFSDRLHPYLKTEIKIDKLMYHYRYSKHNKSYT